MLAKLNFDESEPSKCTFQSRAWLDVEELELDRWRSQHIPSDEIFLLTRAERGRQFHPPAELRLEDIINADVLSDEITSSDLAPDMPPSKRTRYEPMSPQYSLLQGLHHMATSPSTSTHPSDYTEEVVMPGTWKQKSYSRNEHNVIEVRKDVTTIDLTSPDSLPAIPRPTREKKNVTPLNNVIRSAVRAACPYDRPKIVGFSWHREDQTFAALRSFTASATRKPPMASFQSRNIDHLLRICVDDL